jgi:hypothetical protein
MNRGVDRLHRRMREKRQFVGRFKSIAGGKALGDVASRFRDRALLLAGSAQVVPNVFRVNSSVGAFVPVYRQGVDTFLCRPHVITDHRDQIIEHDNLLYARNFPRGAIVDLGDLAAEHRALPQCREFHVGQHRVDTVDDLAVDFVRGIEPLQRFADQHEIPRVLQRNILWRHLAARRKRQRAIGKPASAPFVHHLAVGGRAAGRVDLPLPRGGLNQHGARAGAGGAQRRPPCSNGIGIAGGLNTEKGIAIELVARRRMLQRQSGKIGVEFLGQNHRDRGIDALPHLDLGHYQCGVPRRIDADEGIGRELAGRLVLRLYRPVECPHRKIEVEHKAPRKTCREQRAA